jgi:hypothetical protein
MNGEVTRDLKGQVYEIQVICCLLFFQQNSNTIFFVIISSSALYENIVIFQLIEDDAWYPKDKLREIIHQAIIVVKKNYDQTSEKYLKLIEG